MMSAGRPAAGVVFWNTTRRGRAGYMYLLILPTLLVSAAVVCVLGVWFPALRGRWRRSAVEVGPLSDLGFAIMLTVAATVALFIDAIPAARQLWLVPPFLLGWVMAMVGHYLDKRRNAAGAVGQVSRRRHERDRLRPR